MQDGSVQDMVMRKYIAGIYAGRLRPGCAGRLCPGHGYEEGYSWDMQDGSVRYMQDDSVRDMLDSSVWDIVMRKDIAGICRTTPSRICWTASSWTWL